MPTVKELVAEILKRNGFDGLFNSDTDCGCDGENLAPCGNMYEDCEAGYRVPCDCGDCDFHIGKVKPEGKEVDPELDRFRKEQIERAGPHIGNVLDMWEQLPNDLKGDPGMEALARALDSLNEAMEGDTDG